MSDQQTLFVAPKAAAKKAKSKDSPGDQSHSKEQAQAVEAPLQPRVFEPRLTISEIEQLIEDLATEALTGKETMVLVNREQFEALCANALKSKDPNTGAAFLYLCEDSLECMPADQAIYDWVDRVVLGEPGFDTMLAIFETLPDSVKYDRRIALACARAAVREGRWSELAQAEWSDDVPWSELADSELRRLLDWATGDSVLADMGDFLGIDTDAFRGLNKLLRYVAPVVYPDPEERLRWLRDKLHVEGALPQGNVESISEQVKSWATEAMNAVPAGIDRIVQLTEELAAGPLWDSFESLSSWVVDQQKAMDEEE